jgi:hypothetical protein
MKIYFMMKLFTLLAATILFISCKKNESVNETIPEGTVLKSGTFMSNSKTTSGTVKIIAGTNGAKKLVFESFSTGSGPDVRVWLSPTTSATAYQEVGTLRAFSGTFSYDLAPNIDYDVNNKVLIWCEDVNILFGNAMLQ